MVVKRLITAIGKLKRYRLKPPPVKSILPPPVKSILPDNDYELRMDAVVAARSRQQIAKLPREEVEDRVSVYLQLYIGMHLL